jgi:hypothetical protein
MLILSEESTTITPSTSETSKRPGENEKIERKHVAGEECPAGQEPTMSISGEVFVHIDMKSLMTLTTRIAQKNEKIRTVIST